MTEQNKLQRSYEVSIWSLQDEFITVLKAADVENIGQITKPNCKLKTDGTQELTFSIPMYIYQGTKRIENPLWYNTKNGNLIVNMRKIKLIFNKHTNVEKVFEFIITKVGESRKGYQVMCDISCEGLAFHELGKIGYKISLSSQVFYDEDFKWFEQYGGDEPGEGIEEHPRPVANLQYWLKNFLTPLPADNTILDATVWYYDIQMDWGAYAYGASRANNKIYEQPYTSSWSYEALQTSQNEGQSQLLSQTSILKPQAIQNFREKQRMVDLEQSNIYNLTQDLAKTFGVFCRYEYGYDQNYHIISRKVIFYNNFMKQREGYLSITYPYSTSEITRSIDSTDLTTKMYVSSVDNSDTALGWSSIMNVEANKTGQDYILNFEYLHKIKAISDQQYQKISEYQTTMHRLNQIIAPSQRQLELVEGEITEAQAKLQIAENAISQDLEQVNKAGKQLQMLQLDDEGLITKDGSNPVQAVLFKETEDKYLYGNLSDSSELYYVKIADLGVVASTVRIFKGIDYVNPDPKTRLKDEVTSSLEAQYDTAHNLVAIHRIPQQQSDSSIVYLTYKASPQGHYTNIFNLWLARKDKDQEERNRLQLLLGSDKQGELSGLRGRKVQLETDISTSLLQKKNAIAAFERLMGPALRESYWKPEDFKDTGNKQIDTYILDSTYIDGGITGNSKQSKIIWTNEALEGETKSYYPYGTLEEYKEYPYIILSGELLLSMLTTFKNIEDLCVIYRTSMPVDSGEQHGSGDSSGDPQQQGETQVLPIPTIDEKLTGTNIAYLRIGSQCQFGFRKFGDYIFPVIILTSINDDLLKILNSPEIYLGKLQTEITNITDNDVIDNENPDDGKMQVSWLASYWPPLVDGKITFAVVPPTELSSDEEPENKIYYLRLTVDSLFLKTSEDSLNVLYNQNLLTRYEDYSVIIDKNKYYTTIKPLTLIKDMVKQQVGSAYNASFNLYQLNFEAAGITPAPVVEQSGTDENTEVPSYIEVPQFVNDMSNLKNTISFQFALSNADISIYLDALQVMKENSMPKVEYSVTPAVIDDRLIYTAYNNLARIVNINDYDLKLEEAQGYISELDLDLVSPSNDKFTIANYKNKFEDLFSTIVAQTEAMKKSEYTVGLAASIFNSNGELSGSIVQNSLSKIDLNYAFNSGKLTITERNGIWAISDDGVVAMRGGGIFTASKKDANGSWIWNTGITPQGISADLITAGQLDTDKITIFAGNRPRFQLNKDGLYAYKTFTQDYTFIENASQEEANAINNAISSRVKELGYDPAQYVVFNSQGLFLRLQNGALVLNEQRNGYTTIQNAAEGKIDRVAITWNGLTLKNNNNEKVFQADAKGNLHLKAQVAASSFIIENDISGSVVPIGNYTIDDYMSSGILGALENIFDSTPIQFPSDSDKFAMVQQLKIKFNEHLNNWGNAWDENHRILASTTPITFHTYLENSNTLTDVLSIGTDGIKLWSDSKITLFSSGSSTVSGSKKYYGTFSELTPTGLKFGYIRGKLVNNSLTDDQINPYVQINESGITMAAVDPTGSLPTYQKVAITPTGITLASGNAGGGVEFGSFIQLTPESLKIGASSYIQIESQTFGLSTLESQNSNQSGTRTYFRLGTTDEPRLLFDGYSLNITSGNLVTRNLFLNPDNSKSADILRINSSEASVTDTSEVDRPYIKMVQLKKYEYKYMDGQTQKTMTPSLRIMRNQLIFGSGYVMRINNGSFRMGGTYTTLGVDGQGTGFKNNTPNAPQPETEAGIFKIDSGIKLQIGCNSDSTFIIRKENATNPNYGLFLSQDGIKVPNGTISAEGGTIKASIGEFDVLDLKSNGQVLTTNHVGVNIIVSASEPSPITRGILWIRPTSTTTSNTDSSELQYILTHPSGTWTGPNARAMNYTYQTNKLQITQLQDQVLSTNINTFIVEVNVSLTYLSGTYPQRSITDGTLTLYDGTHSVPLKLAETVTLTRTAYTAKLTFVGTDDFKFISNLNTIEYMTVSLSGNWDYEDDKAKIVLAPSSSTDSTKNNTKLKVKRWITQSGVVNCELKYIPPLQTTPNS